MVNIQIQAVREGIELPAYAHKTDAGMDVRAAVGMLIPPGHTVVIPTGIAMAIPEGYEVQIRPRSGVSVKTKLRVAFGTIDSGYRGEVGVIVDNISKDYIWEHGEITRIPPTHHFDINGVPIGGYCLENVMSRDGYYEIRKGDRIAQLVLSRVEKAELASCDDISAVESDGRGTAGYGSSGTT